MSRSMNRVTLIGRLGNDAEIRHMNNGNAVVNFNIATSEAWKDKQTGESKEITDWHRVVVFGKLAEALSQYLVKGCQVYVEGALKTRQWQNQDGQTCYATEVVVSMSGTVMLLGNMPKPNSQANVPESHQAQPAYQQPAQIPQQQPVTHQSNVPVSNLTQGGQNAAFMSAQNQSNGLPQNSPASGAYAYGQPIDYDDNIPF